MLDQKCFCHIFIKFYWNKCVSVNILICAWKHGKILFFIKFTETLCFGRKKQQAKKKSARTVLDQKCFCHIFIKFYQNKCVSVSILICTCRINSTKTLCFGRKKQGKNCAWSKVFLSHFYKVLLKQMCFSQYLICARINSTKTLCFGRKKTARTVLDQKCFSHIFIKFYSNKCVSFNILICALYQNTLFW